MSGIESSLLLWETDTDIARLTDRQQELYQDLAFLLERRPSLEISSEISKPNSQFFIDTESQSPPRISLLPNDPETEARHHLLQLLDQTTAVQDILISAENELNDLSSVLKSIKGKTDALYKDCEDLVKTQQHLSSTADLLHTKLEPLLEYDRLVAQFSAPNLTAATPGFAQLLTKLENILTFIGQNQQLKEYNVLRTKHLQLFSTATTLMRNEIDKSFRTAQAQMSTFSQKHSMPNGTESSSDALTAFYSNFLHASSAARTILRDVDDRSTHCPEHYSDLIQDVHKNYFSMRSRLLEPLVNATITELRNAYRQNICELLRQTCSFIVRLCREEFRLYHHYFTKPSQALSAFLSGICQSFYDTVRPEIIHLESVDKISNACSVLNQEILREYRADVPVELGPFVEFIHSLLADCRERLMFKVNAFVAQEITAYVPGKGDLAYPEKLEILYGLVQAAKVESRERISSRASVASYSSRGFEEKYLFSAEAQGFWYPTLRRAVGFLSKLYNSLDSYSFRIAAQEVISRTMESLGSAGNELLKPKGQLHRDLFLISHILVLREHLTLFQIDLSMEEQALDFTKLYGAAKDIITRRSSILTLSSRNALLEFFVNTGPEVKTSTVDCRREVDSSLRSICLQLVDFVVAKLIGPLVEFVEKASVIVSMEQSSNAVKLRNQAFAAPTELKELVSVIYRSMKNELPAILRNFLLYLISLDTLYVLYKPVRVKIWATLDRFNKIFLASYTEEERAIIAFPSMEQWNVILNAQPAPVAVAAGKNGSNGVQHV